MADDIDSIEPADISELVAWPPIPETELFKGNTLTPDRLRELGAISGDPTSAKWAFALLRIRDEIQAKSAHAGKPLSVRVHKGGLHINTDSEAVQYHDARGENSLMSVRRQVSMLAKVVDPSKLSSAEQQKHDRALCVWGARMAALKRANRAIDHNNTALDTAQPPP